MLIEPPEQIEVSTPALAVGKELTVITVLSSAEHPRESVTTTVYVMLERAEVTGLAREESSTLRSNWFRLSLVHIKFQIFMKTKTQGQKY